MKKVVVLGDPIRDHHLYRGIRPTPDSPADRGLRSVARTGGAWQLFELVRETLNQANPPCGCEVVFGLAGNFEELPARYHAYALWDPQPAGGNPKDPRLAGPRVWRVTPPPLGYGRQEPGSAPFPRKLLPFADAGVLVLDDAGLDFRTHPLALGNHEWIVLKLTGPIGEGRLWESLQAAQPRQLVMVVSAAQLRRSRIRLGNGLSWEATTLDLLRELEHNHALAPLKLARHLFVAFDSDAALWLPRPRSDEPAEVRARPVLVFDGERAEGEWQAGIGPGIVFGHLSCFTAAIVHGLCQVTPSDQATGADADEPDFEAALVAGLTASRQLHRLGHGPVLPDLLVEAATAGQSNPVAKASPEPGFPLDGIARAITRAAENPEHFATTELPDHPPMREGWMLLDEWHVHSNREVLRRPYFDAALAAAVVGPAALDRFPVARFGALRTVDRGEIEGLRIVRQAMQSYRDGGRQKKPLNLGVFGPPGAGKSFGVGELVKAVFGNVEFLTFNLSQFSDPSMLIGAFHQIRDRVVAGETPVAFWDEFDSQSFRWLQYLLAPMNDGVFQDGAITHPIGKCVFIFAGATSHRFASFGPPDPADPDHPDHSRLAALDRRARDHAEDAWRDFVLKKGPDFKSRLVATLDVLGPNPSQNRELDPGSGHYSCQPDPADRCWPIRRAFFIRSQFKLEDSGVLDLDHDLLRALLEVPRYKSGARSLEFLCDYLRQRAGGGPVRRSHLPGDPLLARHVDLEAFTRLLDADLPFLPTAEKLAPGLHEDYRKLAKPGARANVPWEQLEATFRDSTVAQALRIHRNLAVIGLTVEPGDFPEADQVAVQAEIERHLDTLAEAEHNGWMVERLIAGWRYSRRRDDGRKRHNLLVPYAQLPESEKAKDRHSIAGYTPPEGVRESPTPGYVERLKCHGYRIRPRVEPPA